MDNNSIFFKEQYTFNQSIQIQSPHIDSMSNCIVFNGQQLMLTMGSDGQIHLYQHKQSKYVHLTSNKIFDCPIISYDLLQQGSNWKLLLISLSNRIAACRIIDKKNIIIYENFKFPNRNSINSCVWGRMQNEILLGVERGQIYIMDIATKRIVQQYDYEQKQIKLLRCKGNEIYLSNKNEISRIVFEIQAKSVIICDYFIQAKIDIVDFTVTSKEFNNFLVVLTNLKLFFFYLEDLDIQPQVLDLKNQSNFSKIGWGKTYDQIGVYRPIINGTSLQIFICDLNGIWKRY